MELFGLDFTMIFLATLVVFFGTIVGMLAGALPGLGAMVAIIIMLPLTYNMSPLNAILLLLAVYQAAEYGGSISSITLGIPGTPAAAATILDGFPLARKHSPGKALGYSLLASTIGGIVGALVLAFLAFPMAKLALQMSEPEFFLIGLLGLIGVAALSSKDKTKSAISVVLGLLLGTVGMDDFTGTLRFTGNSLSLMDGISMVAVVTGVFGISEILSMLTEKLNKRHSTGSQNTKVRLSLKEFNRVQKPTWAGSAIGTLMGIFPGLGPGAASFFSYSLAKKMSKSPDTFGKGNPEGIAAAESSNNAAVGGGLLPLLTIGIPGSGPIAVIMGAFIIHGIQPGPQLLSKEPTLVYGIFFGFFLTTIAMYIIGRILTPNFARVLSVPISILAPMILIFSLIGVYTSNSLYFDIWVTLLFGVAFFILKMLNFSIPSFILAFILSPIIETSLRRSLIISDGSYSIFVSRPYSIAILVIIVGVLAGYLIGMRKEAKKKQLENKEMEVIEEEGMSI